jgi:hypothetical protein
MAYSNFVGFTLDDKMSQSAYSRNRASHQHGVMGYAPASGDWTKYILLPTIQSFCNTALITRVIYTVTHCFTGFKMDDCFCR